ncbi:MAG: hypothetical protein AMJ88_11385 [Anaerolineae bacterium SM23_ 63]|nr:MAG: hypothetical protein AMJ88_11385 [Anaerolineae bacterium SM23_ 63]
MGVAGLGVFEGDSVGAEGRVGVAAAIQSRGFTIPRTTDKRQKNSVIPSPTPHPIFKMFQLCEGFVSICSILD